MRISAHARFWVLGVWLSVLDFACFSRFGCLDFEAAPLKGVIFLVLWCLCFGGLGLFQPV